MYPLNRTGQKSKNLTNNNMYMYAYRERNLYLSKYTNINTDFLLSEKTFLSSISLEFFYFFFFVVKSFSYSNFLTLDNGSAL